MNPEVMLSKKQTIKEISDLRNSNRMLSHFEIERLRMLDAQLFVMNYCKGYTE
jgi:hypothetical protein